jgi:hypothetical protein
LDEVRGINLQNDNGGDKPDTETGNDTTSNHETKTSGGSLEDTTDSEDTASHDNSEATTDEISHVTSDDCAKEGTLNTQSV